MKTSVLAAREAESATKFHNQSICRTGSYQEPVFFYVTKVSLRWSVAGVSDQSYSGKKEYSTKDTIDHNLFQVAGTAAIHEVDARHYEADHANEG